MARNKKRDSIIEARNLRKSLVGRMIRCTVNDSVWIVKDVVTKVNADRSYELIIAHPKHPEDSQALSYKVFAFPTSTREYGTIRLYEIAGDENNEQNRKIRKDFFISVVKRLRELMFASLRRGTDGDLEED